MGQGRQRARLTQLMSLCTKHMTSLWHYNPNNFIYKKLLHGQRHKPTGKWTYCSPFLAGNTWRLQSACQAGKSKNQIWVMNLSSVLSLLLLFLFNKIIHFARLFTCVSWGSPPESAIYHERRHIHHSFFFLSCQFSDEIAHENWKQFFFYLDWWLFQCCTVVGLNVYWRSFWIIMTHCRFCFCGTHTCYILGKSCLWIQSKSFVFLWHTVLWTALFSCSCIQIHKLADAVNLLIYQH